MKRQCWFLLVLMMLPGHALFALQDENLVLYITFDEGQGEEAKDLSQYGHHAKVDTSKVEWVEGKYGKAIHILGDNQECVVIPHVETLKIEDAITMMAWVNLPAYKGGINQWIDKACHDGGEHKSYCMWEDGGVLTVRVGSDQNRQTFEAAGQPLPLNDWQHVAFVYDGQAGIFYLNGEEISREDRAFHLEGTNEFDIQIGCPKDRPQYSFTGVVDEVIIFKRALDQGEIQQAMEGLFLPVNPRGRLTTTWGQLKLVSRGE